MTSRRSLPRVGIALLMTVPCFWALNSAAEDPPKLEGTWTWEWKDADDKTHHHSLTVEGEGTKLAARERFDDEAPIKVEDFEVDGKKVTFSVSRGERRASYSGTLDDSDTINGNVTVNVAEKPANEYTWTAKRKKPEATR